MKDKDYLLIKATLSLLAAATGFGAGYFTFDNKLLGITLALVFADGIIYRTYKTAIKTYLNKESEVIYNGFNLKGQIMFIAFWATMTYLFFKDNKGFHYLFYGLFSLLFAVEEGLKLIIFDFSKRKVVGLFDNKNQVADQMAIEHIQEDLSSYKIKLTDNSGVFMLDKANFNDNNWTRLVENLDKLKMGT